MKILRNILWILTATLFVVSCTDDDHIVMNSDARTELSLSAESVVLTKDIADQNALTITLSKPQFGFDASYTSKIIFTLGKKVKNVNLGSALEKAFTVSEFNAILLEMEASPKQAYEVSVYGEIELSKFSKIQSAKKTLNVTPYADRLDLSTTWGVVGDATLNGWNGPDMPFYKNTANPNEFVAYVTLKDGEIKFRENNAWDNNLGGVDGKLEKGAANIKVEAGTYKITLNISAMTYEIEILSWGLIGSATTNGWKGPDMPLTYDPTSDMWRAIVTLGNGEIKIRQNNDWGVNFGDDGADGTMEAGGANIKVEAGTYLITVNFNDKTYTMTSTDLWGLVGNATPNSWDGPDYPMMMDYTKEGVWYANGVTLVDGEMKFRANNDWGKNYGDDGADGTLEKGGANIKVEAGKYNILLDLSDTKAPIYTMTKL